MVDAIVIGAGISGLVAARQLKKDGRSVLLIDGAPRPGGVIRTLEKDGFRVEMGPNSVRMTDELEALVGELGLEDDLLSGAPGAPRYIYRRGKIHPAPMGLASLITTPLVSVGGKLRLLGEPFARAPKDGGEPSIEQFITRRLGREIHDVFVAAFISGVYAGDTSRLSAAAVFPKLVDFERQRGSILRGALASMRRVKKDAGPRPKRRPITIVSFTSGLAQLPERIAQDLGDTIKLNTPAEAVEHDGQRFLVHTPEASFETERLFIATPTRAAAALVRDLSPAAAALLDAIEYPPLASVSLAYKTDEVDHPCSGFGFLAPRTEDLRVLGGLFPSSLFPGRAPEGWHLLTCFIGGATDPDVRTLDDAALVERVAADLKRAIGAKGAPKVVAVSRWERAIPQYTLGHVARIAELEHALRPFGIRLLGNYLDGVSVGDCVARAQRIAAENP